MSSTGELACTYATLILHDDAIPITADKIATLVKKANVQCESYWPSLFAKLAERKNIEDLITNVGAGTAAVAVSASAGGGAAAVEAPDVEEKKKEEKEESDDELMFSIFD
ncbi:hypothetical protein MKX01_014045 [Papaver californicum]|nr:hypothetical protein MKX01_014045 [Papaver californicum]